MSDKRTVMWSRILHGRVVAWAFASVMAAGIPVLAAQPVGHNGQCVDQVSQPQIPKDIYKSSRSQGRLHYTIGAINIAHGMCLHCPLPVCFLGGP